MDSRDLQERIEELEELFDSYDEYKAEHPEEVKEYKELNELKDECEGSGWDDGIYFIPDYEFEDYCRELAEDCYITSADNNPLLNYVDWEKWARDCSMDYSEVEFRGTSYYWREA